MRRLLFLALTLILTVQLDAQTQATRLSGVAPEYAGRKIELLTTADPVTGNTATLGIISVLPDGSFETNVLVNRTTFAFALIDRWKTGVYLQPGASYQLVFPPLRQLTEAEKRNPFFEPEEIAFGLKNTPPDELNHRIDAFERAFAREEARYFDRIFKDKSDAATDSMIARIDREFTPGADAFFDQYKYLRLATVRFAQHPEHSERFVAAYLDRQPLSFGLPVWVHLFDQQFANYFYTESNRIGGDHFRAMVGTANLSGLFNYLTRVKKWSGPLSRMIILKAINDAYYQARFNPQTMLVLLEKIEQSTWPEYERRVGAALSAKLRYLTPGTPAPVLTGTALDGKTFNLNELKGKLVYLHFTSVGNPICRQHLDELKNNAAMLTGLVEIVNLILPTDATKRELIARQNWPGRFVVIDEAELEKYRVKTVPTAYLIGEDGNLLLSPALNPIDGFQKQAAGIIQQRRVNQLRNSAR